MSTVGAELVDGATACKQTVAPTLEPLSLTELKSFLRIDHELDDTLLTDLLASARAWVEKRIGRQLLTATWTLTRDAWPIAVIYLPYPPAQSVSSIAYIDSDGVTQTWAVANYRVDVSSEPARITPAYNVSWPTLRSQTGAVTITYLAGWTAAASVPAPIRQAIRIMVAHLYEYREPYITGTIISDVGHSVEALLAPYNVNDLW